MSSTATGKSKPTSKSKPVYSESELYDPPEDLARFQELAPLLRTWQAEVWEKDHSEFRGCWHYDQEAIRLQQRHRWAVVIAAITGTVAVVLAISKLGIENRDYLAEFLNYFISPSFGVAAIKLTPEILIFLEVVCLSLALVTILLSISFSLDHRWRELRFKAEHYRMLKFRFLLNAAHWREVSEEDRGLHLFTHLTQIHSVNKEKILEWIHWRKEILPKLEPQQQLPQEQLANELREYFRDRRLSPQRRYFAARGHKMHNVEKIVRWIGPGLFFASVVFAFAHAMIHVLHPHDAQKHAPEAEKSESARPEQTSVKRAETVQSQTRNRSPVSTLIVVAMAFALLAAILPVVAAGVRTWRGAFEFGRNSLRFESMAHQLEQLLTELEKSQSPEAIMTLLRRGEYEMESEHRAWMRLMVESEWFG
jgi:hypothetical protein